MHSNALMWHLPIACVHPHGLMGYHLNSIIVIKGALKLQPHASSQGVCVFVAGTVRVP